MARPLSLPKERVRLGTDLPGVCVRHGVDGGELRRQRVTFTSATPWWLYPIYLVCVPLGLIVAFVVRKTIIAATWAVCDSCRKLRQRCLSAMAGCLLIWIPLSAIAGSIAGSRTLALLTFLLMPLASLCFAVAGSWSSISKAYVSSDGKNLRVTDAHPAFVASWKSVPQPEVTSTSPREEVPSDQPQTDYSFFG